MIFKNNEYVKLDELAEFKEFTRRFDKGGDLAHLKFPILFKSRRSVPKFVQDEKGNLKKDIIAPEYLNYKSTIGNGKGITDSWIFSELYPEKDDKDRLRFRNGTWIYNGTFNVHAHEMDKLFYLLCKSKQVKDKVFWLHDEAGEQIKLASQRKLKLEFESYLYGDKLSDDEIKLLAKSYGIDGVDSAINTDIVRNKLYDVIIKEEETTRNGISRFYAETKAVDVVKVKAEINDAIENFSIKNIKNRQENSWYFLDEQKQPSIRIMKMTPNQTGDEVSALAALLLQDNSLRLQVNNVTELDIRNAPENDSTQGRRAGRPPKVE